MRRDRLFKFLQTVGVDQLIRLRIDLVFWDSMELEILLVKDLVFFVLRSAQGLVHGCESLVVHAVIRISVERLQGGVLLTPNALLLWEHRKTCGLLLRLV